MLDELARWGIEKVEFDQTGRAAGRRRPRLARGAVESVSHDAGLRGRGRASGARRLRLDRGDAAPRPAARARLRHRAPLGDEVPRRPRRRARRRARVQGRRGRRPTARVPLAYRPGPRVRHRVARSSAGSRRSRSGSPARRRPRARSSSGSSGTRVTVVRYPGFGGLLSFDVADAEAARRVETSTRLIANMTSLGGVTSRIEARARWEGERVSHRACSGSRSGSRTPRRSGTTSSARSASLTWLPRPHPLPASAEDAPGGRRARAQAARGARRGPRCRAISSTSFSSAGERRTRGGGAIGGLVDDTVDPPTRCDRVVRQGRRAPCRRAGHGGGVPGAVRAGRGRARGEYDGWEASAKP